MLKGSYNARTQLIQVEKEYTGEPSAVQTSGTDGNSATIAVAKTEDKEEGKGTDKPKDDGEDGSDDDDDDEEDAKAEVDGLQAEGDMPIEELMKKYKQQPEGEGGDGGGPPPAKRARSGE